MQTYKNLEAVKYCKANKIEIYSLFLPHLKKILLLPLSRGEMKKKKLNFFSHKN